MSIDHGLSERPRPIHRRFTFTGVLQYTDMEIALRNVQLDEEALVFSFLVLAARMPEGGEPIQRALSDPTPNKYWRRWGRPGDIGIVAEHLATGMPVGCAWLRLFNKEQAGASFYSERVPELAMSVVPEFRGNGIGATILHRLATEVRSQFPGIVLSVRKDNPAARLYERLSFKVIPGSQMINRVGTESIHMYLDLRTELSPVTQRSLAPILMGPLRT